MIRTTARLLAALPLALLANTALAADGTLEINQDCAAAGCFAGDAPGSPVTLPANGRYRLSSDLTGGFFIQFGASALDVDLDLAGHSIDGGGRCLGLPVTSCSGGSGQTGISLPALATGFYLARIHDGTIRGFAIGIGASSLASGSSFENLLVTEISNNAAAVYLDKGEPGSTIFVRHSRFVRNRADGMRPASNPGDSLIRMVVEDSQFAGNGNLGLGVYAGSVVTRSSFVDNANFGLSCSGNNAAPVGTALSANAFLGNKVGTANSEYNCTLRDMGGNVCQDGSCP